ncbi:ATP-binding protein [Ammoniphilus sp. 3BR4]|uniref:ATP-binding protein n=1 Tax=Ammoniphilus sp. 3BR4 TaxID=3158265 RepID=UPI00346698BF
MAILTPKNILHPEVALTCNTKITNGTHILYVSMDKEKYLENAFHFISSGLSLNQGIIFVDEQSVFHAVQQRLTEKGYTKEQLETIIFNDHDEFYKTNEIFDTESVIRTFSSLLEPLLEQGPIRHWGKVKWLDGQVDLLEKIKKYEMSADEFINQVNSFGVCAYDGMKLPLDLYMELMKHHQYIMTDTEFTVSGFYKEEKLSPSVMMEANYVETISHLQAAHAHYLHFIEEMPDATFIISSGTIVYANKSALKLMEAEQKELLIGKSLRDLTDPTFPGGMKETGFKAVEQILNTLKGKKVNVEVLSYPFVFEDLQEATISIVRDIRERKEYQKLLIRNEKLGIAGQLAASIAHEIRNPLTAIKGFLKLANEGTNNFTDFQPIIDAEIDRIETIASELLVLGKPVSLEMKKSDVGKLLNDVCILMQSQANMENVLIDFREVDRHLYCECNEEQIKQVIMNLIKNAIEALEDGGSIWISAYSHQDEVIIKIADNGKGVPENIKAKLGEPFYTTKAKGTGLGLMICYNIISQHQGQIHFVSREGEGTVFTIQLPLLNDFQK